MATLYDPLTVATSPYCEKTTRSSLVMLELELKVQVGPSNSRVVPAAPVIGPLTVPPPVQTIAPELTDVVPVSLCVNAGWICAVGGGDVDRDARRSLRAARHRLPQ